MSFINFLNYRKYFGKNTDAQAARIGHVNAVYDALSQNTLPYKVYVAKITQTGTSDPTVTVLENTLGSNLTWQRNNSGNYSTGATTILANMAKTTITCGSNAYTGQTTPITVFSNIAGAGGGNIYFGIYTYSGTTLSDDILKSSTIEIRVYN